MATASQWLLLTCLGFCAAWMDERPVLESRDGNLFISAAKDKNITLKTLGDGQVTVNEINLLHVATAAESATHLIERWRTGYLAEVESNLHRLTQIVEGPEGLEKRIAMMKGFGDGNNTLQPETLTRNQSITGMNSKIRMIAHRVRRVEEKVRSIESKLRINECTSNPCQNGGSCQDLYEGYQCHCPSNWEGPNCVVDVNECVRLLGTDLGCQNGATCLNLPGSYRCECAPGWFGLHCNKKSSICNTQNSDELCGHGVCVAKTGTPLGYTCICDQGWQADSPNPACIKDVDECAGNHRPCSVHPWVACRNAPGTFFCDSCPQGYTGNGYYCIDIDECLVDNGGCSTSPRVQCINTMGSRMCGPCPTGYQGDGVTCTYVGSCAINNGGCHPLAACIKNPALPSSYVMCRCPIGMVGDGIGPNGCQPSTDVSVNALCSSNPCVNGRCIDNGHSYTCACNVGYTGATCNVKIDPCTPNPCKNSGVCVISNGGVSCDCTSTYTGSRCEMPRQTCGGVSRNPVGHLEFPIGGNVYQKGLSCAWVLVTNSSLVLNVTFTRFNLEQSTDCKFDFLQIHDGRNAGSQMIGRFCGNTFPNENGNIVSSHNSLYFWFHSDDSVTNDGFAFHWNSIKPVCGGSLTADYGTISSPGSPGRYPPNRDCYWQITVRPSKRIQIHFGLLMLEEHPICQSDFLEISTIHQERLGLYCNHTHPPPLVVPASEVVIHFHSDGASQDAGFQIHYSTIEGIPGCNDVYTATTGTIRSPGDVGKDVELECEWKIQMPVSKRIEVTWSEFELSQLGCKSEYIEIYDGETSESPLLDRFCGNAFPPTIRSNSNVMLVIFKTNVVPKGSFALSYKALCGGIFTEETGIIQSPMYPQQRTNFEDECVYEIKPPANKRIVLHLLDIDIRGPPSTTCYLNYFRVFDSPKENATRLANICASELDLSSDNVFYSSTHNYMMIKYRNTKGRGFLANYTTIDTKCGGLYTESGKTIQVPTKNYHYANNLDCVWTIQAPAGYIVKLTWLEFDLEQTMRCRRDYVKVYENYMSTNREELGTFCEQTKPPMIQTQGNELTVVFHSDSSVSREGFTASYVFINSAKSCGGHFIKKVGVLQSPNYPHHYPNKRMCEWVIEAPNRQRVILTVQDFKLEQHSMCNFDYLEIRDGGYVTSPLIGKFCGTNIPSEIISQTNQIHLLFVSDQIKTYSGFSIAWDSTTIGCGGTLNAANGEIMSPNYPQPYMSQADCTWKIVVAEGNLIQLLIVDLQVEQHSKCRFDYIEISEGMNLRDSQRYCGRPYPQVIQTKSNVMNIRFYSDYTNTGRGFHLKYETLCHNKIHGFYGVIESPNFPNKYKHNLNCSWTIDAPKGNKINLTFSHFELENKSRRGCNYDYVEVYEGIEDVPQDLLKKLCSANEIPPKIHSTQPQVFVKFITDSIFAYRGFRLEWVVDGCGGHLTKPADSFTSPGYPSAYPTNIECEWLIEVDYMHSIELTVHDINTEKQRGCYYDRLQIYSGVNDQSPLLVEFCYSAKPVVYTSFGNAMFLKFHSDSLYSWRGFNVSYKSVPITCGGKYTADRGIIFSTNYPKNYPNKQNCNWLIQVDQNYVVNITFLDFDVEDTKNCTDDYVQIYDGPTKDSPLLGTHCRNDLPPSYVSTSNEMLVVMRSDSMLSAKGFKAQYHKACGARIIVENEGFIVPSMSYTDNVDMNLNCTWILVAKNPADHVTVTFTHMEIYRSWDDECLFDYIRILEGEGLDGPTRGTWCEDVIPLPVTSNGNALTVHLYMAMDFIEHVSFMYSVLNSACGGTYTSYRGTIASPNYPNSYPLNSECVWILKNSPGNRISLTFSEFDLQQSENCDLDYLEIREDSGIGKLISISCGTNVDTVQSTKSLWIKFKSDGDDVGKGFVGEFTVTAGDDLTGPMGRITTPLYPMPYKRRDNIHWRITVDFGWLIRIQITDLFIETLDYTCFPYLRIYDGYDNEAPILLEACGFNLPDPVTSVTNVVYVELSTDSVRHDSWFDLNWIQIPRDTDNIFNTNVVVKLPECNQEVGLLDIQNSSYEFSSPGWPDGYQDNLHCNWVFTSPPGTHLVMRILTMDLEETSDCVADFVAVYSGNALTASNNAQLIRKLCLANSTSIMLAAGNVMTVKFESDSFLNKTGFSAYVYRDCGGKLEDPNGEIEISNVVLGRGSRVWKIRCEWVVEVKPGRTIQVQITKMSIQQGPSFTCTDNYLMLKNGGEMSSPLLGVGKYCGNVTPEVLETTGNRLYVKAYGVRSNVNFQLAYRQVSTKCGGEFILSSRNKKWEISTPNYPNIPHPYTECTWTAMAPGKERISINFIERFDLSYTLNCEKEYVEVRDGGTDSSKLLGRFCKDVPPNSMTSTGNMLFVHFYTDIPEPKNGFKAVLTIEDVCGGIIRGVHGIISSPNYPFYYPKNQSCTWHVIAPTDHTLKFSFMDMHLPGYRYCKNTDYVEIFEMIPGNDTNKLGTYCNVLLPEDIETASNEAVVTFHSDNIAYTMYRGFSLNFSTSQEVCGGELTAMQGTIKSNGYPNIATRSKYCDWRIKLPKGYQVVVDIQDLDIMSMVETRIGYSISFYNDFRFKSRIEVMRQNWTSQVRSCANTMMIGYYSSIGYRGFKLRYYGVAPAPCGGVVNQVRGNLTGPRYRPFNESSYFCQWDLEVPQSLINNDNSTGVTLSIMITGAIGGIRGYFHAKHCYNYQYISLSGSGMLCGNFSEPMYLRSPKRLNELTIVNGTFGKPMNFKLEYQWQPCGGILQGLTHVISTPKNISYPINCVWHANYPDNGETIKFHLKRFHLGSCDRNYINIRDGGPLSPQIVKFCANVQTYNITSTSNQLWIEYTAMEEPNDFEFILESGSNGCGGALRGTNREISSPKFPSQYPNNAECTWEITAENGYHIGLVFVDRFNLESSVNCEKDYVQIFEWIKGTNETSAPVWKQFAKICGRNTPQPFNVTGNRMLVTFHSNEAIQGDGFRAMWYQNCGGVFNVTTHPNIIVSPGFPNFYQPNLFCNYTLLAPGNSFIIQFTEFQVEQSRKDCRFDNVTVKYTEKYSEEEKIWCGEEKPPILMSIDRAEIIFQTDRYIQRNGFVLKYYISGCGGVITEPSEIKPLMNNDAYLGGITCSWEIRAPKDKSVVLRFESFELEDSYRCMYDKVTVYEEVKILEENKLATLCGNLTEHLPIFKSNSSSMVVEFFADDSFHFKGFSAKVLFVKNVAAGCGGFVNLTDIRSQSFKTQKGSTYDSLEDCHWRVIAPNGKNIKFTINSMDVKNAVNKNATSECTGDYIEIRDGSGPLAELLGRYCGNDPPLPIMSGTNALWLRFFSDGTLEGAGVTGTFEAVDALCSFASLSVNDTRLILTSPDYPNNYEPGSRCRWILKCTDTCTEKLKIRFLDMDMPDSDTCENDFVQITDMQNRKYIEEGFGKNFVWNGKTKEKYFSSNNFATSTAYKYCGYNLPHDYYSYSDTVEVSFQGLRSGYRGFKLEYSKATCAWNFTAEQGRILHTGIQDCQFTVTAPPNHTISLYFNELTIYDSTECTETYLRIFEGDFDGTLLATLCSLEVPSPIFSTGNKLSLRSVSKWHTTYESYDITYTTTSAGRGCGGQIYNYAGSFTSPMYPNEYRENSVCTWDISVPRGLKIALEFPVLDIGTKDTCDYSYNIVQINDVTSDGEELHGTTICGGDNSASYVSSGNRLIVKYTSSMSNIGTGWRATFRAQES